MQSHWDTAILALALVPMLWPLIEHGLSVSADGALHVMRLLALDTYVRQGELLPRWAPDLVGGFGYPVFNFYGPASYYLAEIPRLLGFDAFQSVAIAFGLMLIGAALGMRAFVRAVVADGLSDEAARWAGLVGAVAYGYTPYLLQNAYLRSAIGEVAAQALLPWILWAYHNLARAPRPARYFVPATLLLGGLAIAHNITLILFPPVLVAYVGVIWWRQGRQPARALWLATAGLAAVAVSAFFWVPLLTERGLLSSYAYGLSASLLIPENIWTWTNFIDLNLAFRYNLTDIPFKMGLLQLGLAIAGGLALVRRRVEWGFWIVIAVIYALFAGQWLQGVWTQTEVLQVIQFPWRVLVVTSLAFAFLATGLVVFVAHRPGQATAVGALIIGAVMVCQAPRVTAAPLAPPLAERLLVSSVNTFEVNTGAWGTGSAREFMPHWVVELAVDRATVPATRVPDRVVVESGDQWSTRLHVEATEPSTLLLTDFYFPGWTATTEQGQELPVRASTSLGLLTVDVPAGDYALDVTWAGTASRRWADWTSLAALLLLIAWGFGYGHQDRAVTATAAVLLAVGLLGALVTSLPRRQLQLSPPPAADVMPGALRLAGFGAERARDDTVILHPYWFVTSPLPDLLMTWALQTPEGVPVATIQATPVYGSRQTTDWPAGTLADDRYQVQLPGGLAEGDYQVVLSLSAIAEPTEVLVESQRVATIHLAASSAPVPEALEPVALLNNAIDLGPIGLEINGRRVEAAAGEWIVARAGDALRLDLAWRPVRGLFERVKSFAHLVNGSLSTAKSDQTMGTHFAPANLWNIGLWQHDIHEMRISRDPRGGVYEMIVGAYVITDVTRNELAMWTPADTQLPLRGDSVVILRIKVLSGEAPSSAPAIAALGDFADLISAEVAPPTTPIRAGSSIVIRLTYRARAGTPADLTQFVHVYDPATGLIGQADGPPVGGLNPTTSWQPGEMIQEQLTVTLSPTAPPGSYAILFGLYDPVTGARAPVTAPDGTPSPEQTVQIGVIDVQP